MIWSIDGVEWDYPCDIERVAEVTASEISGMLLDKSYFNDVLGTYLKYTVKLAVPVTAMSDYVDIYEALTNPVDGHTFVLPYNQTNVTITGRVTEMTDVYVLMANGTPHWKGITFTVIANHPTKTMSLSEVLTVGMSPIPSKVSFPDGTVAIMKNGKWVYTELEDADNTYY